MIRVRLRPAAEADIQEATDWYEERESGLGGKLLDELGDAFTRIRQLPLQFPVVETDVRRALLRRFPYAIYFLLRARDEAVVIAVLHQRRSPSLWRKRGRIEGKAG